MWSAICPHYANRRLAFDQNWPSDFNRTRTPVRARSNRHKNDPFFLYLSFNAVHTPMHATDERLEKFAAIADPMRRTYAAMTLAMDEAVGRVIDKLRQADLEQDTLIFFCSDIGETNDLASSETATVEELKSLWDAWNATMAGAPQGQTASTGNRAPSILNSLDADKDGKISRSEAVGDIKANFSFIDGNGDGGIDLDELTRVLRMTSSQ